MKIVHTEVLVIGGGLAGLRVAIGARQRGLETLVLSLVPPKRSHSAAAQGGMQASLGNVVKGRGDNEDVHFEDTVRGSDWGADQRVVRMFVHTAPKAVRELAAWGVPWSRVRAGAREVIINGARTTIEERSEAQGLIAQRDFGGTKNWRTCFAADGTGHAMLYAVDSQAIGRDIEVHERREALALIHDGGRCHGAVVRDLRTGELSAYLARATVIATGGAGRLYQVTTNATICDGSGAVLALDAGAPLGNMEAVQFHPTATFPVGILVTEGCRGDGGVLRDASGHRFMPDYEPEKKELASRDVVSRRMEQHIRAGHGARTRFGEHLWLDITLLGRKHIEQHLREVHDICRSFLGVDPAREWIPVRPAQHYTMGGVRTYPSGESYGLRGLFAAGEAACWDLHGFNRLGGNSVAETVVAGMIIGERVADYCEDSGSWADVPMSVVRESVLREQAALAALCNRAAGESARALRGEMQRVMHDKVGVFRSGAALERAVARLQELLIRGRAIGVGRTTPGPQPQLAEAYRVQRMLRLALTIAFGALQRTESRGAHSREDYPRRDDARWLSRTLATWASPEATSPTLAYEDIDVRGMELPPGWRGYGPRDHVEHPASEVRALEVARLRARNAPQGGDAVQDALMPYAELLPLHLRGPNERI